MGAMTTPPGTDLPALDGVTNFRELGGHKTRDGRLVRPRSLFRSSHWGRASDADVAILREYGVGLVLDFRSEHDIAQEGADRLPEGTRVVTLATEDPAAGTDLRAMLQKGDRDEIFAFFGDGGSEAYMTAGAARLVTERTEPFSRFLAALAEPDPPPALFHCSAGKDRAGWAASALLLALGVDESDACDHYLVSNHTYDVDKQHGGSSWVDEDLVELLQPLTKVKAEYFEASVASAKKAFGSLDGYFGKGLGLSDAQREQLRKNWLEG